MNLKTFPNIVNPHARTLLSLEQVLKEMVNCVRERGYGS